MNWRTIGAALAALAIIITIACTACTSTSPGGVLVIPLNPTAKHNGKTYSEWAAEWWKWAFAQPAAVNPVLDTNGAHGGQGQSGNTWFLAGTFGDPPSVVRTIHVPKDTALFFPLINFEEDSVFQPTWTAAMMLEEIDQFADQVTALQLFLDGANIPGLILLRATTPQSFSVQLPATDDLYAHFGIADAPRTVTTMVADGYWAFIDPLPVGTHTIVFGGTQTAGAVVTTTTSTYTVIVDP